MNSTGMEAFADLQVDDRPRKKPCGCGCGKAGAASLGEAGDVPSLEELEAALAGVVPAGAAEFAEADELTVAGLDEALSAVEDGDLLTEGQEQTVTLEDFVNLAEKYPGLKVTLSF